jgi:hypothetical protein
MTGAGKVPNGAGRYLRAKGSHCGTRNVSEMEYTSCFPYEAVLHEWFVRD